MQEKSFIGSALPSEPVQDSALPAQLAEASHRWREAEDQSLLSPANGEMGDVGPVPRDGNVGYKAWPHQLGLCCFLLRAGNHGSM